VIDRYPIESIKKIGRTKAQVLRAIKAYDIASKPCSEITSADLIAFANQFVTKVTPQTVGNYLFHLAAVFAVAKPAWSYPLDQTAIKDAFVVAKRLGILSKSRERDRRPTLEELDKIMEYFGERSARRPSSIPMQKIIGFAIFSTRRLEEITRILWKDLDVDGSRVLVRDMKNPGEKIGNDIWCDLPPEALQIIVSMPKRSEEILPYSGDTIGTNSRVAVNSSRSLTCIYTTYGTKAFHGYSKLADIFRKLPLWRALVRTRKYRHRHSREVASRPGTRCCPSLITVRTVRF
jgi:integrase